MASGERRLGFGRRGMTVLGKIPTLSVPKPINLPSQRLENRGLEPAVEVVPRGTFSWGSSGRSNGGGVGKSGTPEPTSVPQEGSGAWNDAIKPQVLLASAKDGESSLGSPLDGSSTRPSSAPTTATNRISGSMLKTPVEVKVQSIGFMVNSVEPSHIDYKESADELLQESKALSQRPTSADGVVSDKVNHSQSGVSRYERAGPDVGLCSGAVPEGFHYPGDGYKLPYMWQGMTSANGQPGPYSGPFPPQAYYKPFRASPLVAPCFSSMKERDMVMVRMANSPGLYGSYPPPLRPGEYFGRPGVHHPSYFEQLVVSGNGNVASCHTGMGMFFPDSGYPGLQRGGNNMQHFSSGPIYGNEWNPRMPNYPRRHKSSSREGFDPGKEPSEGLTVAAERKITLLTKAPQVAVTVPNGSIMIQAGNEGSDTSLQAIHSSSSSNKMMEPYNSMNTDGNELKRSSRGHFPSETLSGGSVVSTSPSNRVESKTGSATLSSRHELAMTDIEYEVVQSQFRKSDADNHGIQNIKQACKGALTSGSFEESFIAEPTKHMAAAEDIPPRGDHKAKTNAESLRSEKEWRPKSHAVEAKMPSERVSSDFLSTSAGSSDALQAPSSLPTQKVGKHQAHKGMVMAKLPLSAGLDRIPNSKARDLPEPLSNGQSSAEPARRKFSQEVSSDGLTSGGVGVLVTDSSKGSATEALLPLRIDPKAKSRPSNLKAEKEWRPKSPAVDVSAASDSVMGSQITESNVTSASDVSSSYDRKIAEEGIQPFETYDYERQRAKMKEIAAQRATQRQNEEEERVKEQKAKALAKLEELNRRTLTATSMESIDPRCELPVNEGPNKKLKRKPDSERRSAVDSSFPDPGVSEKQPVDGVMSPSTGNVTKKPSKVGEDGLSDANQTSRNMREELRQDGSRGIEKPRGFRKVAITIYDHHEEQELVGMPEEALSLVHDIEYESSSTKKYGVHGKVREGMKHGKRHQSKKECLTMEDEGRSIPSTTEEHQVCVASQAGNTRGRRGGSSKGPPSMLLHHSRERGTKTGEGSVRLDHFINTGEETHIRRRKTSVGIEQVESEGNQSLDGIPASEVGFGSDKAGRPRVSWRQKSSNENHISISEELASGDIREPQNSWAKSPTQPRNPGIGRDDGGRRVNRAPSVKHQHMETREKIEEHEITELQRSNALCELIPEAVSCEGVRVGPSHNGWRPKSNQSISYESRSKTPEYTREGMLDFSSKTGPRVQSGNKNGPSRVYNAHGQAGNETMMEDYRTGRMRNRHRRKGENIGVYQQMKQESQSDSDHTLPLTCWTESLKQVVQATKAKEHKNVAQNENQDHARPLDSASRHEQVQERSGQHPPPRGHERHRRKGENIGVYQQMKQESQSDNDHTLPLNWTESLKQVVQATNAKEHKNVAQNENHDHARPLHSASRHEQVQEPSGQHPPPRGHERHSRHGRHETCRT